MKKVPKLRFPEFQGEWEEKRLGRISDVRDGTHDSPKYVEDGYPFITSKNLLENGKLNFNNVTYITEEDYIKFNTRSKVDEGDILFGMIGTIGNPVIVDREGFAIKNVALIKEKKELKNSYLIQFLKSYKINRQFHLLNVGGTQKFIALGVIRDLDVSLPSIEEQEKIASFFSLIDKKIENQQQKVDTLQDYKKGMMQKIFSQEIRFKDENGNLFPKWRKKKAEELFINISDKNHNGELEVLSATQDRGVIPRNQLNIDIKYEENGLSSYKRVKINNFVISLRSFQGGIEISKYDGLVSPAYTVFDFKETERQNHDFFSLIFKSKNLINRLNTLIYGIRDGKAISFKDFSTVKLAYPCIEEQEKIALFFLEIDKKIKKEQEKLEYLNQWKKGLLQQMFV